MSQKKIISCKDITLLYEIADEIRKYQGVSGSAKGLFGIEDDFIERIEVDSLNITVQPNWILITGKTQDYDFEVNKFGNIIKIEKCSKYRDVNIIKFVDEESNVHTNSTITNYNITNNQISKVKSIRGKGNATLLCDCDGNIISEEQFWQTYEDIDGNESFKPYVRHQILQAIDNEHLIEKNHRYYYDNSTQSDISYRKYVIRKFSDSKKEIYVDGIISEETYYELLRESSSLRKEENVKAKQKLRNRIFKTKA